MTDDVWLLSRAFVNGSAELLLETPMTDLIIENNRVVGVKATHNGTDVTIRARKGVVLGSGGFDGNREKRKELQGIEGAPSGVLTNLGLPIEIADKRHRRYLRNYLLVPGVKKKLTAQGHYAEADTIEELATKIGIEPKALRETVDRFNGFAKTGIDGDFGRGNSAYDRYYSDPGVHPNPNLGPLEKAPFDARTRHRLWPNCRTAYRTERLARLR